MSANDDEVLGLIARDRKLDAIKHLRETRGLGLSEAKAEVERLSATLTTMHPSASRSSSQHVDQEVRRLAQLGQRIAAIKLLRERNRLGLKQAKELLDAAVPPAPTSVRLPWLVLVALAVAAATVVWLAR